MPLTSFQKEITVLLAQNRSEDSHLADGAALHFGQEGGVIPKASD